MASDREHSFEDVVCKHCGLPGMRWVEPGSPRHGSVGHTMKMSRCDHEWIDAPKVEGGDHAP